MAYENKHPIYSKDASVYIETGEDKFKTLQQAMDNAGFMKNIDSEFEKSGKSKEDFSIVIKPNIMTASIHEDPSPVYTDPQLVEYLIGKLKEKGYKNFAVVEARNVYDYGYTGRDVKSVAQLAGYSGDGYDIIDMTENRTVYDYGSVLGEDYVGIPWKNADYRISFAKNKTHWQCFYTGCLKNIYGCLPQWDKNGVYHGKGKEFYECCILIVDRFPVHFGFMDAWVSGDGFTGHVRDANPNHTKAILASENIFALDWVQGEKMDIDPAINHVLQEAMHRWGTIHISRKGDMTPWPDWTNVRAFSVIALDFVEELYWLTRILSRAFATTQDKRFKPIKRWQWFFGPIQFLIRSVEKIFSPKRRKRRSH
jgi:uncharacterized protein (DUF362 family)